jgi:acetyl-CoA carboxylase biotin carboxyl carrier protein
MTETTVRTELSGTVWKLEVSPGDRVAAGDTLVLLESMKMEIPVVAPRDGVVASILVSEEQLVAEGDPLLVLKI